MAARVEYKASVARDFRRLGHAEGLRVLERIEEALLSGARGGEALGGEFHRLYRLRVGEYRAIYARTDEGYLVLRIGHRREVYRKGRPR